MLGNLIQLTNLVINKGVHLSVIGEVFLYSIPLWLGYILPFSCLAAVILGFSRLSADNEILALRANGIHLTKLLTPLLIIGIILSLVALIINDRIIPDTHHKRHKLLKTLGVQNPTALIEAGMFIHSFDNQILFIHKIDGNKMYNVTIYQPQEGKPTRTIIAKEGEFTPVPGKDQIKLKLINGTSDEPNLTNPNSFYKLNFDNFFMTLDLSNKKKKVEKKPKGMSLAELKDEIHNLERLLVDTGRLETEFHRKITWSFATLIFMMLGFPIAVITHRREKSANVVFAILCAAFYYLISIGCEALSIKNIAPPAIIMWVPNTISGSIALYLNIKCVS